MKVKKKLATLLCVVQLLGTCPAFAEYVPTENTSEHEATNIVEETTQGEAVGAETEIPLETNEIRVFVSTTGDDKNKGTFAEPVLTVERGIELAKGLKSANSGKKITVNLRGGDYYISKSIKLPAELSGTAENPFVIQAYNGENANIKGSTPLTQKFKSVTDEEVLKKIPEEARRYIGEYDLSREAPDIGKYAAFSDMGSTALGYNFFLVNDNEQTLARWPNTGFDRTDTTDGVTRFSGVDGKNRTSKWKDAKNMVVCGYMNLEYSYTDASVNLVDGSDIVLTQKPYYGIAANKRYWVKNLIEELDAPGEYFIDADRKKLYYYPQYSMTGATAEIATMTDTMIVGENLSNVTIRNIGVKNTRGSAISFSKSKNIVIDHCEIQNIGLKGVVMSSSTDCRIVNNTIYNIGSNAISMGGCGDLMKLIPCNNLIDNNHMYNFAVSFKSNNPGISLSNNVGVTVSNNLMHGSSSQAILFSGNDNKFIYNEMYDVVNEVCDAGAIYAGRNYTMRGNEIAYNYIHDIDTTADKGGSIFVAALYLDDLFSSANMHHNIIARCNLGVMIGGGRDNCLDNNILVDNETGLFLDARGVGWGAYHAAPGGQAYNTILWVPYNKPPYSERYPELATILDEPEKLGLPMNNSIQGNVMFNNMANMVALEMKTYGKYDNNHDIKSEDTSIFKDYANGNYELKEGTDIAEACAEAASINMSEIGLREDKVAESKKKFEEQPFRLITPYNGQKGISNLKYTFTWEQHPGANKYIIRIAEDPEMKNVIITKETNQTSADIEFIPSGGKPFWWTVTAVSDSNSLKGEYKQFGAPKLLISIENEQRDKSELRKNIAVIRSLYNVAQEGTAPGTYKTGFRDKVKALLDEATEANESITVTQKEIVAINDKYQALLDGIKDDINYEVINVGELLQNKGAWVYPEGNYTFNSDGSLSLKGDAGRLNHYSNMMYDNPLGEAVAIKFGYKNIISSNYCMVGLQNDNKFLSGGYDLIIKNNAVEIQRRLGAFDGIESTVLNFYISDDKWVDLEIGALRTGIGTYVYMMADGYLVDSFFDMKQPYWSGDIKFVFGNTSGRNEDDVASIRPAQD